jgi:hypothetical protein
MFYINRTYHYYFDVYCTTISKHVAHHDRLVQKIYEQECLRSTTDYLNDQ